MTIWILALVLLASLAAMGYRQGAIRVVFSFAGIVLGALLAAQLGTLLEPLMVRLGMHNRTLIWMLAPLEAFALVLLAFKITGALVHRKVELHHRYWTDNVKFLLWERLNRRLGLCLGVLNGAAYFVLICFVIFNFSYWTAQIAPSDDQTLTVRLINRFGHDMAETGMDKAAHAVAPLPVNFYKLADLAGLLCQNPDLGERLSHYPAFLSLMERKDLQQLSEDNNFTNAVQGGGSMGQLLDDPQVKALLQNQELINVVWDNLQTNLDDLLVYLKTGESAKYGSETNVGYWDFNTVTTAALLPVTRPKIPVVEMRYGRMWLDKYLETILIITPDHQAFLHNLPHLKMSGAGETATLHLWSMVTYEYRSGSLPDADTITLAGLWDSADSGYTLSFTNNETPDSLKVQIKDDRMTMTTSDGDLLVFDRED